MINEENQRLTIKGDSIDECKERLYNMYGKNYRIVDSKNEFVRYGLFNLGKKMQKVITYTVLNHNIYDSNKGTSFSPSSDFDAQFEKNKQEIIKNQSDVIIKAKLNEITKNIETLTTQVNSKLDGIAVATTEKHESIIKIEELLSQNEFTFSFIQRIEEKIRSEFSLEQLDDYRLVQRYVVDWIGESISIAPKRFFRPPHVIIVVGPTGVGKTTTIAKLASNTILDAKKSGKPKPELCILTIDTMRVGALEQLSKFGEILGKNVMKAESSDDVLQIYDNYKEHVDYIFIDTSGYSPNDSNHIGQMKEILDVKGMNADVYLSISASTKASDLTNILRNYEPFGYESVIITKCDETKQLGNVISVLYEKHKSISYITNGQHVPRNIQRADVIEFLKNLNGFDIDRVHIEDKFGEK